VTDQAVLFVWAHVLLDALARVGVTQVVLCPGSRSTPFAWAALQHPGLRCTSLIDERCAGFFALGQAKVSGEPTLLVCTSGTAAANLLPAAVEASASCTPLLLLTADRPFELQGCSAPQTIDQTRLFGDHVRACFELGDPCGHTPALRAVQRKATQAALRSNWPHPGAVHLNARARKPLEPPGPSTAARSEASALIEAMQSSGPTRVHAPLLRPSPAGIEALARDCAAARRGLLVCGAIPSFMPIDTGALSELLERCGLVLLCEASSQLRFSLPAAAHIGVFDAFDAALRCPAFRARATADLVIQIGAPLASDGWAAYLRAHPALPRHVIAPHDWPDPPSTATSLLVATPADAVRALADAVARAAPPQPELVAGRRAWRALLDSANDCVWNLLDDELRQPAPGLSEGQAVRAVVDELPPTALLAVGNSLAIREVDTYCRARRGDTLVWVQRGANGIDGVLSGAAGAAYRARRPTTVLLGDVSFLHDIGGLWAARSLQQSFVVVVLNNDGGRIFEQLPLADVAGLEPALLDYWITPHGLRLSRAAKLYDYPSHCVRSSAELSSVLQAAHGRPGCTVIEVRLPPHNARSSLRQLWDRVDRRLTALSGQPPASGGIA
jgi:2-succinyl-5-enolpyruvyl-6-hydroxy-3-cyclohexene-1-carboxylate synthase